MTDRFIPPSVQGALWMIAGGFAFALMSALIRPASEEMHTFQLVFSRNVFGLLILAPWLVREVDLRVWRSPNRYLHVLRALLFFTAMSCWFTGIPLLPIAEAVALNFSAPIIVTVLAALILGERIRLRRLSAIALGTCGVFIVLRPGFQSVGLGQGLILADAALWACAVILIRTMARIESAHTIVCYMFLLVIPISALPAMWVWVWPSAMGWLLIIGLAITSTIGHLCITQALVRAEASAVMPFDYVRFIWFALVGWLAFDEVPEPVTLVGAVMIAGSAFYIFRREAELARQQRLTSTSQDLATSGDERSTAPSDEPKSSS